jgi:hypothetical protein
MWTGSNSTKLSKFFGQYLTISEDLDKLYDNLEIDYMNCSEQKIKESMNYVRNNHTYLNRIVSMLSIL